MESMGKAKYLAAHWLRRVIRLKTSSFPRDQIIYQMIMSGIPINHVTIEASQELGVRSVLELMKAVEDIDHSLVHLS